MAGKKKLEIEFRYYELPKGEPVLSLYGPNWVRVYGNENIHLHFHNLYEIGICYDGMGTMTLDDKKVSYEPGYLSFIPHNYPHTTTSKDNSLNYWEYIFFSPEEILHSAYPEDKMYVDKILAVINREAFHCRKEEQDELYHLVEMVLRESKEGKNYSFEVIRATLLSIIYHLVRECSDEKVIKKQAEYTGLEQIQQALLYVDEKYMEPILVEKMAQTCSLSETHFRRIFVECMNMTPAEYLTLVRIKKACELLNKSNYSMERVAEKVGYDAVSTFTRNFRKIVGTTPYQFKKNKSNYEGKLLNFHVSAKKGW